MFYTLDWIIIGLYCIGIISLATYVSRKKSGSERSAEDYFLAGRSLPWWAIGASLIAANISAEQIIGMSGQGFCGWNGNSSMGTYRSNCSNSNG